MIALLALVLALLASLVLSQPTPPTFGPAPASSGPPTDPTYPANFGFYTASSAATAKLNKYSHFIEITLASNSFDYVFGAYPGAIGIQDYLTGLQSGKYTPQQYPSQPSVSRKLDTTYPCLPFDFQGCNNGTKAPCASNQSYLATYAASINSRCLPLQPIEMSSILSLKNNDNSGGDVAQGDADTAAWNTDPDHGNLLNYYYSNNGGKMNGFIYWAENGLSQVNNPGFPLYGSRTGGTAFSYYNLSSSVNTGIDNGVVPYLYTLASQYTLFDNYFRSVNGASDIAYLAQFAGRLPAWGADGYTCAATSDPKYGTAASAPYQMVPCQYGTDGIVTTASFAAKCNVISSSDCTWVAEIDGYLPNLFPQANGSLTTCQAQQAAPLPGATLSQASGNSWAIPLPTTFQTLGTQLDAAGQSWAVYGMGLNAQLNGSFCDVEYPNYSGHNNPLHYLLAFEDYTSDYFKAHLRDDTQFFSDLTGNTLPAWSQITFNEVYDGAVSDSNLAAFETQLKRHISAIMASSYWASNNVMIIVHGVDNGGLWDHVPPYAGDRTGPGARTPLLVISPDHANGGVNHYPYETFSLRKMVQTRFGLGNTLMTPTRYWAARDLTNSFDETNPTYVNPCNNGQWTNATQCQNGNSYTAPNTGGAMSAAALASTAVVWTVIASVVLQYFQ